MSLEGYLEGFEDEPGYLDFARVGPMAAVARGEQLAMTDQLARARFGAVERLLEQDARVRDAVSVLTGFRAENVCFQPTTSQGLMQALFGSTGEVALALSEFPSLTFAAVRAREALGTVHARWLDTDAGRVTPGNLREQLTETTAAVAVSLVDFRTGYLADLDGIRQVIGDRLLIVDAIQGFGVVDAPFEVADVVVSGGQKWVRAGWGTGFLALSDRALDRLTPVLSGFVGTDAAEMPLDEVLPPTRGARAFTISNPDLIAQARFAAALEEIAAVGVPAINAELVDRTERVIELADEFAIPVLSSRAVNERAGLVVVAPPVEQLTVLAASLHNHGITATVRAGSVRLSPHVGTDEETFGMLRGAFAGFASAITV